MIFPTLLLTTGLIDDLLSRKVHNVVVVALLALAAAHSLVQGTVVAGFLGLGAAFALLFPLFAFRVLGAGDVKLMMAFGLATSAEAVLFVTFYGMIWAGVFGLTKMILSGKARQLLQIPTILLSGFRLKAAAPVQIPMTFPLVLGWLTFVQLGGGL